MPIENEPQQDPTIAEILGTYYKPEKILAQAIEKVSANKYKISYFFPTYERTINPQGHVSMSQMHEAIMEGLYCSIGEAIREGTLNIGIDMETFLKKRSEAIYFREEFSFRQMLKENEPAELTFEIIKVEEKTLVKKFYSITIRVSGFIRGEVECLLVKEG